jgi:hypothetical protein
MAETESATDVGVVVVSPGEILAEMNAVDAAVQQLDGEVSAVPVSAAFRNGWTAFAAEWRKFYDEHKGLTGRLFTSIYRQTLAFHRRVEEWFGAFAREGWAARAGLGPGAASLPAAPLPAASTPETPARSGYSFGTVAWIAFGSAVFGGLLVYSSQE